MPVVLRREKYTVFISLHSLTCFYTLPVCFFVCGKCSKSNCEDFTRTFVILCLWWSTTSNCSSVACVPLFQSSFWSYRTCWLLFEIKSVPSQLFAQFTWHTECILGLIFLTTIFDCLIWVRCNLFFYHVCADELNKCDIF